MTSGCITEIQRFSLNDGPGIRSTVFTKGCNMRCRWCHNPETLHPEPQLQFFNSKCIGCGGCKPGKDTASAGASDCIIDGEGQLRHYRGNCQARAFIQVGRRVTPEEVLQEVQQDRNFYMNSGGGVTLSGGEVTVQTPFAYETLSLLKEHGIHTAIETNLATSWERLETLLPVVDLVMFDIKSIHPEKHKEWTGSGLERILNNADRISETGLPLIIRTPVIPGFNDKANDIRAIAEHIQNYPHLEYYELLAFNPLGADKYRCLGMSNLMEDAPLIPDDLMKTLQKEAAKTGIEVRIA